MATTSRPVDAFVAIKLLHAAVWALLAGCILALPITALLHRFDWAIILTAIILAECGVLALNGGRCPLTSVAARFTDCRKLDHQPGSDIEDAVPEHFIESKVIECVDELRIGHRERRNMIGKQFFVILECAFVGGRGSFSPDYGRSSTLIARRSSMARYPSATWSRGSVRSNTFPGLILRLHTRFIRSGK